MRSMIIIWLALLSMPVLMNATPQEPDVLHWNGLTLHLHTDPLEQLLAENPGIRPVPEVLSTSNWRGYRAHWRLTKDHLYLLDVEKLVRIRDSQGGTSGIDFQSVLDEMFPEAKPPYAFWYSGHLVIPTDELTDYLQTGFDSACENYIVITVKDGVVKRTRRMKLKAFNRFRQRQFRCFSKTEQYQEQYQGYLGKSKDYQEDPDEVLFEILVDRYLVFYCD